MFYVGRGKPSRPYEFGRNPHWDNIARKHGYTVEVLSSGLTVEEANAREIALIAECRAAGVPLTNQTRGGDGVVDPSDEGRAKLSANNPMKNPAARAKNAEAARRWNTDKHPMQGIEVVVTKTKGTLYRPWIKLNGRCIYPEGQKSFDNLDEARVARRALEAKYWGEPAILCAAE